MFFINTHPNIPRTPWFDASVKPARPGLYEVRHDPATRPGPRSHKRLRGGPWRYWDGTEWRAGWIPFANLSKTWPSIFGSHESHQWRGLAQEQIQP